MNIFSLTKLRSVHSAAITVAVGLLLGRASGLLREVVVAASFGASRDADIAILAMTLPDVLTSLLLGGAVASVLIPQYHSVDKRHGLDTARKLIGQTLIVLLVGSVTLMMGLYATSSLWVPLLGAGFRDDDMQTAIWLSRLALLAFPLSVLSAVVTTALQINSRLLAAASGTLILNVATVCVLLLPNPLGTGVETAAWAVVIGSLARLTSGWWLATRGGALKGCFSPSKSRLVDSSVVSRYLQALMAMGLIACFPIVARSFATQEPGESAVISYALKIMDVPLGLVSSIVGIVILPQLSRMVQHGDVRQAKHFVGRATIIAMCATAVICLAYYLTADFVIQLLFSHGRLQGEATARITFLSQILMLSVPFATVTGLMTALFHARHDTRMPFCLSLAGFVVLLSACIWTQPRWGTPGIATSLVVTHAILAATHWGVANRLNRSVDLVSNVSTGTKIATHPAKAA